MNYERMPMYGLPTQEEEKFTEFLMDGIHYYVSKYPTDRRVLLAALSRICTIAFCQETPFDLKQQCEEIDDFCKFLKTQALKNAFRS